MASSGITTTAAKQQQILGALRAAASETNAGERKRAQAFLDSHKADWRTCVAVVREHGVTDAQFVFWTMHVFEGVLRGQWDDLKQADHAQFVATFQKIIEAAVASDSAPQRVAFPKHIVKLVAKGLFFFFFAFSQKQTFQLFRFL